MRRTSPGTSRCGGGGNCRGFNGPSAADVPGTGDLENGQVTGGLEACADKCFSMPNCGGFEFSPTAQETDPVRNCQLVSIQAAQAPNPIQYLDFGLYLRDPN